MSIPFMKLSLLPAISALITLSTFSVCAQIPTGRPGLPGANGQPGMPPSSPAAAQASDLKRFDLDFPGGTPSDLAAAISKATGKHLNLIIPVERAATRIIPMKVVNVTVSELFTALQQASARQMPVVTGRSGKSSSVQYQNVSLNFLPVPGPITDETVWSFQSTEPTAEDKAVLAQLSETDQVCQYFQLAPYLDDHTVEDITTAVETGWKMLGVEPMPKLSFHQETKLLIAVGAAEHVQQILAVLQQLPLDRSATEEKIAKAMAEAEEVKAAKAPGWEKRVGEIEEGMERLARKKSAEQKLQGLMRPQSRRIPPPALPSPK